MITTTRSSPVLGEGESRTPVSLKPYYLETLHELLERIEALENQIGCFPTPEHDSGWVDIRDILNSTGHRHLHGLNTTELFVYIIRRNSVLGIFDGQGYGMHDFHTHWHNLTNTEIGFLVEGHLTLYDEIRIMIWKIPEP